MKDGGPAFPRPTDRGTDGEFFDYGSEGMSLRDWFAGMALNGYRSIAGNHLASSEMVAEWSYSDAAAMLAEREKQK